VASLIRGGTARIRRIVFVVLAVILVVPTAIVIGVEQLARSGRSAIADATGAAVRDALATTDDAQRRMIATRHEVRLWVVDPDPGTTLFDSDAQPRRRSDLGAMSSFGMQPELIDLFEDGRAKPAQREHAVIAAERGHSSGCATFDDDRLLVCETATRAPDGSVVLAQRAAPRVASRLLDAREGLLWLGGAILLAGAVVAAWLVRRLTRPLDALHRQVAARSRGEQKAIAIPDAPREIAEVASAVDDLATRLEDQHRRQAVAAADLAHELKSPLARIRLALDAGSLTPEARGAVEQHARRAVIAIDRTVADLLEIARAEAGLRDDPRTATDLHELATAVLADRAPPSGITVDVTGAATSTISPPAVTRALGNLLDNAYAHATSRVTIEVGSADGRAQLVVRDDGPGVVAELRPRLFERFASRREGGTGLGLAFVRAVAEAHGGTAELVESPSGAAFVLRLSRA
jgi:two-component system sensor histidine kinase BaeS